MYITPRLNTDLLAPQNTAEAICAKLRITIDKVKLIDAADFLRELPEGRRTNYARLDEVMSHLGLSMAGFKWNGRVFVPRNLRKRLPPKSPPKKREYSMA